MDNHHPQRATTNTQPTSVRTSVEMTVPGTDLTVIWTVEEAKPGSELDRRLRREQAEAVLALIASIRRSTR